MVEGRDKVHSLENFLQLQRPKDELIFRSPQNQELTVHETLVKTSKSRGSKFSEQLRVRKSETNVS